MLEQLIRRLFTALDIFEEISDHINPHLILRIEPKETDTIINYDLAKNDEEPFPKKWILQNR